MYKGVKGDPLVSPDEFKGGIVLAVLTMRVLAMVMGVSQESFPQPSLIVAESYLAISCSRLINFGRGLKKHFDKSLRSYKNSVREAWRGLIFCLLSYCLRPTKTLQEI